MKQGSLITRLIIITAIGGCIFQGCRKTQDQYAGATYNGMIQGTAYYISYYDGDSAQIALAGQMVYVKYQDDSAGSLYIYADKTDSLGNFYFYSLDATKKHYVYTNPNIASSTVFDVPYYGSVSDIAAYTTSGNNVKLIATVDISVHSGVVHHFLNIFTEDRYGGKISNANVWLYYSGVLANADSNFTGAGSFDTVVTDVNGRALVTAGSANTGDNIYIRSRVITTNDTLRHLDTVKLNGTFTNDSLKMN